METKLKKLVLEGFYHEAENLMLTIPLNAQRDIIMDLGYRKYCNIRIFAIHVRKK